MLKIIQTNSIDPYHNLALEESLFHYCEKTNDIILYLWQNDNTIVIGRNQTVFTECNCSYAELYSTKIARRMTGGGAVYHDLGNLNYTIIVPKELYDRSRSTHIIVEALHALGIPAEVNGRNDISLNGLKISGNAYYSSKQAGLHHGTLLMNVDLLRMDMLLNVSGSKVRKRGIASIKSHVVNIQDVCDVSIEDLKGKIVASFIETYGSGKRIEEGYDETNDLFFPELLQKYSSEEWIMNQVPEFSIKVEEKYPWGNAVISCEMEGKVIQRFSISSDSLYPDVIDHMEWLWNQSGCPLSDSFMESLGMEEKCIISDLKKLKRKLLDLAKEDAK